ncbi:MAG: hypothetical protein BGO09_16395 [Bacteroidetes bacterium 47-18]|nr:MAG: hypothetical protein BGO09_16395 [Bacteroidetes bacterium 47-18]
MKKGIVLLTALGSLLLLASCNNETTSSDAPVVTEQETAALPEGSMEQVTTPEGTAVPQQGTAQENPYAHLTGTNPAHGQPNHRCDIPEGAPLNTPPGSTMPQPTVVPAGNATSPVSVQPAAPPAQQTAPGFSGKPNPAHGEPGHRCDLEVGATLP